jgi:hypothetical protein
MRLSLYSQSEERASGSKNNQLPPANFVLAPGLTLRLLASIALSFSQGNRSIMVGQYIIQHHRCFWKTCKLMAFT